MRYLFVLLTLSASVAFGQSHEQNLSTLGIPQPPNTIIGNCTGATAPLAACTAGSGITIANGTISSTATGGSPPAGNSYSVQYNNNGTLAGSGPGTSGQVLTSNGPSSAPTFQTASGGGAGVSSLSAGSSNLLTVSPTTGASVVDITNLGGYTLLGNTTSSTAAPTASTMQNVASAWVAVNENALTVTPGAGPTSDYNPSGWGATIAYLHVNPASGNSTLRGLTAGSNMQAVIIDNAESSGGTDFVVLNNEDSSDSTAGNRFHGTGNLYIPAGGRVICVYTSTLTRWGCQ